MPEIDVVLVRWPDENERLEQLRDQGRPRLLLVQADASPPVVDDGLEDWIRVPAGEMDLRARVDGLERRCRASRAAPPVLDEDGVLRLDDEWVALPPVESRLTAALLDRFGAVVSRDALAKAGWPAGAPGRNALDVHVLRLRRRLEPVGLAIRTVRSRGYLLERRTRGHGQLAAND
jgi:DNA-binding response OmpR family regulator